MTSEEELQTYNDYADSLNEEFDTITEELTTTYQITLEQAKKISTDVWYLRTRSRWTQELEDKLVMDACNGIFHNMNEYP